MSTFSGTLTVPCDLQAEIEKVKRRRQEREAEKVAQEEEKVRFHAQPSITHPLIAR